MAGTFEIFTDKSGDFRFRLKSGNGQIVLSSQGYSSRASAVKGIESVQKNAGTAERFEKTETSSGKFRFNLKSGNHQVVGTSQSYESASSRDNGIEAVGRAADGAKVVDAEG